jgi:hypothetical protein
MSTTWTWRVPKTEYHRQVITAAWTAGVVRYRVAVTGCQVDVAASLSRLGSRSPLARGRPGFPVRWGGSSQSAASLRSRVVQVIWAGSLFSSAPA